MCTFEEMIRMEGYRKAYKEYRKNFKEGYRKAQLEIYTNMKNAAFDDQTICSLMGISMWKLRQLRKLLSGDATLKPKTV